MTGARAWAGLRGYLCRFAVNVAVFTVVTAVALGLWVAVLGIVAGTRLLVRAGVIDWVLAHGILASFAVAIPVIALVTLVEPVDATDSSANTPPD